METALYRTLIAGALWWLCGAAESARILLLPSNCHSHVRYIAKLGLGLAEQGHVIVLVLPSSLTAPEFFKHERVQTLHYRVPSNESFLASQRASELMVKSAFTDSMFAKFGYLDDLDAELRVEWDKECEALHADTALWRELRKSKFDLSIVDNMGLDCEFTVPYSLDIPIAAFSIFQLSWWYRLPALPSFYPGMLTDFTDVMTFKERVLNVLSEAASELLCKGEKLREMTEKYVPHRPPVSKQDIARQYKLWFGLYDVATSYPTPLMPNTIPIGDIILSAPTPLADDVLAFVAAAEHGVVIVSFGSFLNYMPKHVIGELCAVFKAIPQRVVWKLSEGALCQVKDKVMPMKWMPQNDLLGHAKVKLFISHVGLSSLMESVYHGVPIIGLPVAIDQPYNAAFVASRKYGVRLDLATLEKAELEERIAYVINDPEINRRIQRGSEIMRNKQDTAAERASFWINHVTKYGDGHLRSGAFELNLLEFFMFDVFLFLTVVVISVVFVTIGILYCCIKCCCRLCRKKDLKLKAH